MTFPQNSYPDLVVRDHDAVIFSDDQPLKTAAGNEVCHPNERLLKHVLTDLLIRSESKNSIVSADILEYEIDHINKEDDFIFKYFDDLSYPDPFYILKSGNTTGKSVRPRPIEDHPSYQDISITLTFWTVSSILKVLNNFISQNLHLAEVNEEVDEPVILLMKQFYIRSSPEKKSAIALLWQHHQPGLVLPFLFISGLISSAEYAKGVIALNLSGQIPALPSEGILPGGIIREAPVCTPETARETYRRVYEDAVSVQDYLAISEKRASAIQRLDEWIRGGESAHVEFKSTFRWDLKQNKGNPAVERASLKTICGFLNSSGGTLLIGIRDDGSVEGIESDRFANEDKFLLHLWTLIRTCLGRDVSPYIQTILEKREEKTVCVVICSPSVRPVFLRQPGFDEEFYIRLGPGSAALDISEALKYIADRFSDNDQ